MIPCVTGYINKVIMAGQGVSTGPQQEGNSPVRLLFHRTERPKKKGQNQERKYINNMSGQNLNVFLFLYKTVSFFLF